MPSASATTALLETIIDGLRLRVQRDANAAVRQYFATRLY